MRNLFLHMAHTACICAYDNPADIEVCDGAVECVIRERLGMQIISPRGSDEFTDWIGHTGNFSADFTYNNNFPRGVHSGAYNAAAALLMPLVEKLDPLKPIAVSGHSRGGAIAAPLAYLLFKRGYRIAHVVSIGSPRVFSKEQAISWSGVFKKQYIRVTRPGDIVAWTPPLLWGYRHQKGAVVYVSDYGVKGSVGIWALLKDSWRAWEDNDGWLFEDIEKQHSRSGYMELLEEHAHEIDQLLYTR